MLISGMTKATLASARAGVFCLILCICILVQCLHCYNEMCVILTWIQNFILFFLDLRQHYCSPTEFACSARSLCISGQWRRRTGNEPCWAKCQNVSAPLNRPLTPKSAKGPSYRASWATRHLSLLASVCGVL